MQGRWISPFNRQGMVPQQLNLSLQTQPVEEEKGGKRAGKPSCHGFCVGSLDKYLGAAHGIRAKHRHHLCVIKELELQNCSSHSGNSLPKQGLPLGACGIINWDWNLGMLPTSMAQTQSLHMDFAARIDFPSTGRKLN